MPPQEVKKPSQMTAQEFATDFGQSRQGVAELCEELGRHRHEKVLGGLIVDKKVLGMLIYMDGEMRKMKRQIAMLEAKG